MPSKNVNWLAELQSAVCEQCDWRYLAPPGSLPTLCPHCFQASLTALTEGTDALADIQPPELYLPFTVAGDRLTQAIDAFAGGIWFAPADLNPQNLKARLQRVYLPMWLVDSEVEAIWQAETGFNYQVVSHQDSFDQNRAGWVSREVTETRIRWEPRAGRLQRPYQNIVAPALEEHYRLSQQLGRYELKQARPYQPGAVANSFVRLPNRPPAGAWPEAVPPIRTAAAEECRQACRADHLREFRWSASYANRNWTLLLLPMYVTYYLDDEEHYQPVLIHGQSGRLQAPRRASMRRARQVAFIILAVAGTMFLLSLIAAAAGLVAPPLLVLGVIGLVIALALGLLAIAPIVIAWQFNRTTARPQPGLEDRPSGN